MFKKDVELFVLEKRKNNILRKEWKETAKKGNNLKENEQESFFNKELSPIAKKYGFDFSYNDFCEYKKHNPTPNNYEELSNDELFNVAGGRYRDLTIADKDRLTELYNKKINNGSLNDEENKEYNALRNKWRSGCSFSAYVN